MFRVSVDVGGTFTDLVALNEETGKITNIKTPSVPRSPEKGVMNALNLFLESYSPEEIAMIGHATTIATNALFGQIDLELPRTALITTKGFKDIIEIGRQRRAEVYNLFFQRPSMLVKRRHRYELDERIEYTGEITTPLNDDQVTDTLSMMKHDGIESVAIGFLNSYANPEHESMVYERIKREFPELYVTASHQITNEYREYERFSTAVVNSVLMPIIHTYISKLEKEIIQRNVTAPFFVMQSNGGMAKSNVVSQKPATIVESGPAAGVIASAWLGEQTGIQDIISFDMGGTTAKAGTIRGRVPEVVPEYEVAGKVHMGRLVKGSGYPVRFPFIDLAECSAGGGTIAKALNGTLSVGPTSAGAVPGPACYGRGGKDATITDANLLLGRLSSSNMLGGEMDIHPLLAEDAFKKLSRELDTSPVVVATSVIRIANSMMSQILRIVSVERGYDPRGFCLVAFGGAGPMHVCALAEELEIDKVLIPLNPGMFSALGLLTADLFHDYSHPILHDIHDVQPGIIEEHFQKMESSGSETLTDENIPDKRQTSQRTIDLRYKGQGFELNIPIGKPVTSDSLVELLKGFHRKHREVYGYSAENEPVEVVNLKLRSIGTLDKPQLKVRKKKVVHVDPVYRDVFFENLDQWVSTPVFSRDLFNGDFDGPAIIEQYDATSVVYPGWSFKSDKYGNLVLRRNAS